MERLLTISLSHDGAAPVTLASNSYDALGRLTACAVNGGGSVTRFAYNVRGWTQGVANHHFSQQIHYQDAPQGGVPCWGGGISGVTWRQRESLKAESATESVYRFSYDGLDRLTKACFTSSGEQWNGDLISRGDRDFSCTYSYDLNGNMLTLQRHGVTDYVTSLPTHVRAYGIIDDLKNGLDCYDSQARWYAPQTGRTSTLDPMPRNTPTSAPTYGAPPTPSPSPTPVALLFKLTVLK